MVPVLAPDGTPIALVADWEGEIKAVNLKNGKTRFRLRGHTQRVDSIDTTALPDGTPVAVACDFDQNTTVWGLRDGSELPYRLPCGEMSSAPSRSRTRA